MLDVVLLWLRGRKVRGKFMDLISLGPRKNPCVEVRAPHITGQLRQGPGHACRPAGRAPQLQPHPCLSEGPSGPAPLEQQGRGAGALDGRDLEALRKEGDSPGAPAVRPGQPARGRGDSSCKNVIKGRGAGLSGPPLHLQALRLLSQALAEGGEEQIALAPFCKRRGDEIEAPGAGEAAGAGTHQPRGARPRPGDAATPPAGGVFG